MWVAYSCSLRCVRTGRPVTSEIMATAEASDFQIFFTGSYLTIQQALWSVYKSGFRGKDSDKEPEHPSLSPASWHCSTGTTVKILHRIVLTSCLGREASELWCDFRSGTDCDQRNQCWVFVGNRKQSLTHVKRLINASTTLPIPLQTCGSSTTSHYSFLLMMCRSYDSCISKRLCHLNALCSYWAFPGITDVAVFLGRTVSTLPTNLDHKSAAI